MKTKIFKTALPIMAFLMVIGLAFATSQNQESENLLITGYIHENGLCVQKTVNCNPSGSDFCELDGSQVYTDRLSSTTCISKMRDWIN